MRPVVRRLLALDEPQEARFFLFLAAFGIVVGVIYWFVSYEVAGTILLIGFGLAPGLIGVRLVADPGARRVRAAAREQSTRRGIGLPDLSTDRRDEPGGGTGGVHRPYLDETGRLPEATYAPFAVGLGVAAMATAVIFGPATLVVGILPFAWGAARWFAGASDEFDAVDAGDVTPLQADSGVPPSRS